MLYSSGRPGALGRRGISALSIDQPGTGEALRINELPATYATEQWASPVFDWLAARPDVDAKRIGMAGISLGGHFVGRAVAKEPRFACGAVWARAPLGSSELRKGMPTAAPVVARRNIRRPSCRGRCMSLHPSGAEA